MTDVPTNGEGQAAPEPPRTHAPPPPPPPAGKPDLGRRFIAALIDAVIAIVVGFVPLVGGLAATAYWLVRDGLDLEFMDRRSIGKKVMKLRPVTLDGSPVDIVVSVKRNWMFALGGATQLFAMTIIGLLVAVPLGLVAMVLGIIEIVLVLTDSESRRFGDRLANTRVIETDS